MQFNENAENECARTDSNRFQTREVTVPIRMAGIAMMEEVTDLHAN
jgi:hypothetical protein